MPKQTKKQEIIEDEETFNEQLDNNLPLDALDENFDPDLENNENIDSELPLDDESLAEFEKELKKIPEIKSKDKPKKKKTINKTTKKKTSKKTNIKKEQATKEEIIEKPKNELDLEYMDYILAKKATENINVPILKHID